MKNTTRANAAVVLSCLAAVALVSGCGQVTNEKRVETSSKSGDASTDQYSQKVTTDLNGDTKIETKTVETVPASGDIVTGNSDVVRIDTERIDVDTSKPAREPLVRVKSDGEQGSVHIKLPFVKIDKDGHGDKTRIKLPGIRINSND